MMEGKMQINVTTDYAIRSIVYLATTKRVTPASEIGNRVNISKNFVVNTMKNLRDNNMVDSVRGVNGGFFLAKKPEDISLYDVMIATEGDIKINRSEEVYNFCKGRTPEERAVKGFYQEMQDTMMNIFKNKTIADLMDKKVTL